jgi:cyclopropane-fatty-acyl-phospholipid synthase
MIRDGALCLVDVNGKTQRIGDGSPPVCTIRLHKRLIGLKLVLNPGLFVPEAYMDGTLTIEEGSLRGFLDLASRNYHYLENHPVYRLVNRLTPAWRGQYNPLARARSNIAHHYDLSDELYSLFLDSDRQYSCAYFTDRDRTLEDAQLAKKRHIAAKLALVPGQKILDIGSGWGGLALYVAGVTDVDVTGVTLSTEQYGISAARAVEAGLDDRVHFRLQDYRDEKTTYDRIVSVGMFEHVGKRNYGEFFATVRRLLADDGVMVLHSIGRLDRASPINPFIRKYIFPGADLPTLSEVMASIEAAGLMVTDVEILRLHYAETLRLWSERFQERREEAVRMFDERFCRMWELYLIMCEMSFRHQAMAVFQIQITKKLETLPLTRDYMYEWERWQAKRERRKLSRAA